MKTQKPNLNFEKDVIVELNDNKLQFVKGGTATLIPQGDKSIQVLTVYIPPAS